jgi:hypothetical protein
MVLELGYGPDEVLPARDRAEPTAPLHEEGV